MRKLNSTRFLVDEKYEMPFPLSERRSDLYLQIFNTIEENGKLLFMLRSYDSNDKHGKHFWLPSHIQQEGDSYLKMTRMHQTKQYVKLDIDLLVAEIELHDDQRITFKGYSHFCPRVSIGLPESFERYFGRNIFLSMYKRLQEELGENS